MGEGYRTVVKEHRSVVCKRETYEVLLLQQTVGLSFISTLSPLLFNRSLFFFIVYFLQSRVGDIAQLLGHDWAVSRVTTRHGIARHGTTRHGSADVSSADVSSSRDHNDQDLFVDSDEVCPKPSILNLTL